MTPNNIAFTVRIYRRAELALLDQALFSLRQHYPDSFTVVVSDGLYTTSLNLVCRQWNAELWTLPPLKGRQFGGRYLQTWLDVWNHAGTYHLIKFDPDTVFWRPFRFGSTPGVWGTVQELGGLRGVQGGCVLYAGYREIVPQLSDALSSKLLEPPCDDWEVPAVKVYTKGSPLIAEDWALAWAIKETGRRHNTTAVRCGPHPEINSHWSTPPDNPQDSQNGYYFAATHPHKEVFLQTGTPSEWLDP